MAHGWAYLWEPVAGYLIVPSKLIQGLALSMSAVRYPALAMVLTIVFHTTVLVHWHTNNET